MTKSLIRVAALQVLFLVVGCTHLRNQPKTSVGSHYLFVQISESGTIQGDQLTLHNVAAQTIFFSDRPKRIRPFAHHILRGYLEPRIQFLSA